MDKRQVEANEESMFRRYIRNIKHEHPGTELSYFEMNLEVQKQKDMPVKFKTVLKLKTNTLIFLTQDLATIMACFRSVQHHCHYHRCTIPSKYRLCFILYIYLSNPRSQR
jgi:hypothetical protein